MSINHILQGGAGPDLPLRGSNILLSTGASNGAILTSDVNGLASWQNTVIPPFSTANWTPTLSFGGSSTGIVYSLSGREGRYVRIGNLVAIECVIAISNKGSSVGDAIISGLPFSTSNTLVSSLPMAFNNGIIAANSVYSTFSLANSNFFTLVSTNTIN